VVAIFQVFNVSRNFNSTAHTLSREAAFNNVNNTWLEDTPHSIAHIVTRELVPRS
jgi:hypothetical protein